MCGQEPPNVNRGYLQNGKIYEVLSARFMNYMRQTQGCDPSYEAKIRDSALNEMC